MTMATDDRSAPLSAAFDDNQDTRDRLTRLAARASAGATSREDFSVTLADGGRRWLGVVGYPLAGMPGHVVWAVADVTAEREVAKAAREELGRLADFFDHAPVGLFSGGLGRPVSPGERGPGPVAWNKTRIAWSPTAF